MYYDKLTCTTCGMDKICVVISTFDVRDPMRVPRLEPHCTECLHVTFLDIEDDAEGEATRIHRIK